MTQADLFADVGAMVIRLCGTCVTRNAEETEEHGDCSRHGRRRKDDAPCAEWFGLEQLRRPLYGRKAKA